MAGLLGEDWDDPKTQFNLMLAAGLLGGRGNFGQVVGGALPGAMQARNQAQAAIQQREFQKMQMDRMKAQAEEDKWQAQQRQAAIEAAKAKAIRDAQFDAALRGAVLPAQDFGANLPQFDDQGGVMPSAKVGPRVDQPAYLAAMAQFAPKEYIDYLERQKVQQPKPVANNTLELLDAIYPPGHPNREKALRDAVTKATTHPPVFGTTQFTPPGQKEAVVAPYSTRTGQVGPAFGTTPKKDSDTRGAFKDAQSLRKEFEDRAEVKLFRQALPVLEGVRNAPDTSQGDLNLIYAVGKVLDPNSVVRESEMELVIKSGSPLERITGFTRYVVGKGRLTPEARANLIEALQARMGQYQQDYSSLVSEYSDLAIRSGFDPKDIILNKTGVGRSVGATGSFGSEGGWSIRKK